MSHPKLDPTDPDNPTEIVSFRLTRRDHERVKDLARAQDRPRTSQLRHLVKTALNLSAPQARKDGDS